MSATEKTTQGIDDVRRVHVEGEKLVLELRAYLQRDGTFEVRWLTGRDPDGTQTRSHLVRRAYEAVAKNAIDGIAVWSHIETKEE